MTDKRVNLFEKAAADRRIPDHRNPIKNGMTSEEKRQAIADANMDVADRIMATKLKFKEEKYYKDLEIIRNRPKGPEKMVSCNMEEEVDTFLTKLSLITDRNKSDIINELLIIEINNSIEIQGLIRTNSELRQIYNEFIRLY